MPGISTISVASLFVWVIIAGGVRLASALDREQIAKQAIAIIPLDCKRGTCASFSRDGSKLLVAGGKVARVWDVQRQKSIGDEYRIDRDIVSAEFSADGKRLLIATGAKAQVYDVTTARPIGAPIAQGSTDSMVAALDPDGTRVLTGVSWDAKSKNRKASPADKVANVWNVATGKAELEFKHDWYVNELCFSPDGSRIVTVCAEMNGNDFLWDARTGKQIGNPIDDAMSTGHAVAFSADGRRFATIGFYHVQVYNAIDGKELIRIDENVHDQLATSVSLNSDGSQVVIVEWLFGHGGVYDVATGTPVGPQWKLEGETRIGQIFFLPDDTRLYVEASDYTSTGFFSRRIDPGYTQGIWDIKAKKRVMATERFGSSPIAFSPDGKMMAVDYFAGFALVKFEPDQAPGAEKK